MAAPILQQIRRYNNLVRRLLRLSESEAIPEVNREIRAALVLESDRPEWFHLSDTGLLAGELNIAAVAAETSTVYLRNPAGSNTIGIVTAAWCRFPTAAGVGSLHLGTQTAALATAGSECWRDTRRAPGADDVGAALELSGDNLAAPLVGVNVESVAVPAGTMGNFRTPPYILGPGRGLYIQSDATNLQIIAGFQWYERAFEKTEAGF